MIEIMVVLVIIGILLALILPRLAQSRARATLTACVQNLRNIGAGLQTYANDNSGRYPTNLSTLSAGNPAPLPVVPTCPSDGSSYQNLYVVQNLGSSSYTLACAGVHHLHLDAVQPGFPQYYSTGRLEQEGSP